MDLSRAVYNRDLKIAAMRALDAGSATGEIARKYQLSPNLLTRWRGEWRAKGLKTRFGHHLLTKNFAANQNELKVRVLCHLCVLIEEAAEHGIISKFERYVKCCSLYKK